ncbi:hypothetical protein DAH66_10045 [Sphingomonas koreensis]|uniref:Uncharacterized protein n=1 Tax=Sphingomonas koreensis TaxID=93064 RepID=A0A430G4D2_9SPHN|nr:hypothetical protein [Sphingomonas koreensis]RSY86019.1 hypothetical protein DAH66_10045 [Sphingomonas koreensis]
MTRALALQAGIGIASGIAGLALLRRRAATPEGVYATRIAGMMLVALCLFLTGFALVFAYSN